MGKRDWTPLRWCTITLPSHRPLPVWLSSDEHESVLTESHVFGPETAGFFDPTSWRIVIWAGAEKKYLPQLLFHELGHAALDGLDVVSGMAEETVLHNIDASLAAILKKQGWEPPALPEGLRSLAQHARAIRRARTRDTE